MPQMGVSVAEGTIVAWRVEVGDTIEAEATICEITTDKIDTEVPAPVERGRLRDPRRRPVRRSTSGRCWPGSGGQGPATAEAAGSRAALTSEPAEVAPAAPAEVSPAAPAALGAGRRCVAAVGSGTPVLAGGLADRRRARHRPGRGGRHRPQRTGAQAGRARAGARRLERQRQRQRRSATRPTRRCTSRVPTGLTRRPRPPALRRDQWRRPVAHAPADRRAHEALAGDGGHLHDLDRGRHEPGRGRSRRLGVTALAFVARASIERCASTRRSTPGSTGSTMRGMNASTWASRSRWARTA